MFKTAVSMAGRVARAAMPARQAVRRLATEAGATARTLPSAEELQRTQGFLRLVDDRLAERLRDIVSGMGRMEGQIGKLESKVEGQIGKMEGQIGKLESKMEGRIGKLESKMEGQIGKLERRMDKFVTKEDMGAAFKHMETQLKNYLLMGTGSVVVTGAMLAARAGFFGSPSLAQAADAPMVSTEPARPPTPTPT